MSERLIKFILSYFNDDFVDTLTKHYISRLHNLGLKVNLKK